MSFVSVGAAKGAVPMNRLIEEVLTDAVSKTNQPEWLWRNILKWRWSFACRTKKDVEAFMRGSVP